MEWDLLRGSTGRCMDKHKSISNTFPWVMKRLSAVPYLHDKSFASLNMRRPVPRVPLAESLSDTSRVSTRATCPDGPGEQTCRRQHCRCPCRSSYRRKTCSATGQQDQYRAHARPLFDVAAGALKATGGARPGVLARGRASWHGKQGCAVRRGVPCAKPARDGGQWPSIAAMYSGVKNNVSTRSIREP